MTEFTNMQTGPAGAKNSSQISQSGAASGNAANVARPQYFMLTNIWIRSGFPVAWQIWLGIRQSFASLEVSSYLTVGRAKTR